MTTPPTPAGWYPDPESTGAQRYWNGTAWTEHRSPAYQPPPPPPPPAPPQHVEPEPTPEASFTEPTPAEPVAAQSFDEPTSVQSSFTEPTTRIRTDSTAYPPPSAGAEQPFQTSQQPYGYQPSAAPDDGHRKLVVRFAGVVGALLLVAVAVGAYAAFFHKPASSSLDFDAGSGSTSTSATVPKTGGGIGGGSTAAPFTPIEVPPEVVPSANVDGPLAFTVSGVETGDTITSDLDESLNVTADGQFVVVSLSVQNTGPELATFLTALQKLNAGGVTYDADGDATLSIAGNVYADINPGETAEVQVAFDIPAEVAPESVQLFFLPTTPGIVLPL